MCSQDGYSFGDGLCTITDIVADKQPGEVIVIAVSGGSCSGKSYFCEQLGIKLNSQGVVCAKIILDDYFRDIDDPLLPTGNQGGPLFDNPESYRISEIHNHLMELVDGKPINGPVYNIARNCRISGCSTRKEPEKVILVDGLFAVEIARDINVTKLNIFIDASPTIRLRRRVERDAQRFDIDPNTIERVFWGRIEPAHQRYVEPQRFHADFVIDSGE